MYLEFYGLKDEPFRLTPDPRYLHLSDPHQAALTALLEGIFYRKGLVMLTGPIGTGKTTLVHSALQIIADRKMPIKSALLFNPVLTRDEFLEITLDEFEVHCTSTSKPRRLAALHQMLIQTQRARGTAVLFVDEAHLLSPELLEEIRLLGNADTHEGKLLQIVLSGQPELLTIMQRKELSALQQRIAARANLRPLNVTETKVYVSERLRAAGLQGQSPFTETALEALHAVTDGVPRLINLVGDACLALGFRHQQGTIPPKMIQDLAASLELGVQKALPPAKNVVRAPVWQKPVAPIADTENTGLFVDWEKEDGNKVQAFQGTNARPTESILIFRGKDASEGAAENLAVQKTAVDRLIDAMKQTRTTARGTR